MSDSPFYPSSIQFPEVYEPLRSTNPDTASVPSSLQPVFEVVADADIGSDNGKEPTDVDKKPLEPPRLPVRTASPTSTALRAVLMQTRASLADEEKKHDEKVAPENNEVLRAKK
ncbi:uncharacterized protein N7479_000806 [Penicillium vulpinum]|uniref:Uncharacterized protein n=1 Tax=Penicillium vulpinum TaxID=29845 RepID=A0A1V6S5S9_9EURO|nr:uncharacterized protein N7479_000806 [Penicillium vulpinum]KAJ5970888.1 hypothetical protein N7479_000806 [Penicillium vulpinum]OQE09385.1 hypothetical protein PENVUL_c006G05907 [Penicillium vulpinum]